MRHANIIHTERKIVNDYYKIKQMKELYNSRGMTVESNKEESKWVSLVSSEGVRSCWSHREIKDKG